VKRPITSVFSAIRCRVSISASGSLPSPIDVIVPLVGCGNGPSGFTDGLCEVEAFLSQKSRKKAVESGSKWFEKECRLRDITWQHDA
jgi:hypothetical protein